MAQQPSHAAIKISNRELDGAGHCAPSKCPGQGWWHQAGIQHCSEAQLTYPAAKAAALWKHRACTSPKRQNEQPEHKPAAPQQQSTKRSGARKTSGFSNLC